MPWGIDPSQRSLNDPLDQMPRNVLADSDPLEHRHIELPDVISLNVYRVHRLTHFPPVACF